MARLSSRLTSRFLTIQRRSNRSKHGHFFLINSHTLVLQTKMMNVRILVKVSTKMIGYDACLNELVP